MLLTKPQSNQNDAMKNKIENMTQEIERLNLSKRPIEQSQKQPCFKMLKGNLLNAVNKFSELIGNFHIFGIS